MTTDPVTVKTQSYLAGNNQLWNIPTPFATLSYDALERFASINNGGAVTVYVRDGNDAIAEYDSNNVLQKRYAFDGDGDPLVAYDAAGNRTWMLSDERGSVVALANDSAAMTAIDTYDEYGIPAATNQGTFQYAGMMWLSRPGLYAPAFRAYAQHLGRFNQTDPIGMAGGINLYAYVANDPVKRTDPLGLFDPSLGAQTATNCVGGETCSQTIIVTGTPLPVPALGDFVGLISSVSGLAAILATDMRRDAGGDKGQKQKQQCQQLAKDLSNAETAYQNADSQMAGFLSPNFPATWNSERALGAALGEARSDLSSLQWLVPVAEFGHTWSRMRLAGELAQSPASKLVGVLVEDLPLEAIEYAGMSALTAQVDALNAKINLLQLRIQQLQRQANGTCGS
jgi:RHS repeat-associated protein